MTEEEFVALAAVAGWGVDICPTTDGVWSGLAWQLDKSGWYAEASSDKQRVVDELYRRVFDDRERV
jgi:hypothetical protein